MKTKKPEYFQLRPETEKAYGYTHALKIGNDIKISGAYSPPFRDLTNDEQYLMISKLKKSGSDFLWVGLGLPKQEAWITKYKSELEIPWSIGVGAAFDFHSGNKKRVPRFMQYLGIEWFVRMVKEPRMIPRNFRSFYQFLRIIFSNISTKRFSN